MTRRRFTSLFLAVLVVGGIVVFVLPRARLWGEERLRREIETRASAILGGPVRITRLRVGFLPPGVRAEVVQGERHGNRGSQILTTADEVAVRASILTLLGARSGPFVVKVKRPHITVRLAEGRGWSIDGGAPGSTPLTAVPVPPGSTLDLADAVVEVDVAGGPSFKLEGVGLEAAPRPDGAIEGRLEFGSGFYQGPAGEWHGLSGSAAFVASGQEVRLDPLAIRSEGLSLSGKVTARQGAPPALEGAIDLGLDVGKLTGAFPEGAAPSGRLKAALSGSLHEGAAAATGTLEVENFALWGLSIGTLRSDLVADGGLHLRGIRAHLLGGEATGAAEVRFLKGLLEAEADLRLDGIDAAQVLEYAGWTGPSLTGTIHYSGKHRIDSTGLASLRGQGVVDAVGHYLSPRGQPLPLEVTVDLVTQGETIRLLNGSLRAGSTRASFAGRVARGEGITLKMSGGTGDLSEILPLFAAPRKKPPPKASAPGAPRSSGPPPAQRPTPRLRNVLDPSRPPESPGILLASWPPRRPSVRQGAAPKPARPPARRPARPAARSSGPSSAADTGNPLERIVHALGGRWEWDGDLSYGKGGLNFTGRLGGSNLTFQGTPLGSLRARIVYRDDSLLIEEATLEAEKDAVAHLSGRINFRGKGSMSLEGTASRFPLAPVMAVAGLKAPLEGRLSGSVALAGTPAAPTGRARIEVSPAVVAGVEFDALRGDLLFTPDLLEMQPVTLSRGAGQLTVEGRIPYRGSAWVPEEGSGPPRIAVKGSNLDLSLWPVSRKSPRLEGTAALEGSVEGALEAPRGSLALSIADLRVGGVTLGNVTGRADLTGEAADIALEAPEHGMTMNGRIGLGEGRPVDLKLVIPSLKLRSGALVNGASEDVEVVLGGEATIQGRLDDPTTIAGHAVLRRVDMLVAGVRVEPEAPIELSLVEGRLRLSPAVLSGTGTRIELQGEIDPGAAGTFDLAASGRFDLKLLRLFLKNLQATGEGTVVLHVGGPIAAPVFDGRLAIEARAIRHPDLPFPIDDLLGKAEFEGTRLKIESLEFLAGGGPVQGSGGIEFGDLTESESPFRVRTAEVRFRGFSVKADFPQGFRSVSDVDLTVSRAEGRTSFSGTIDLMRGLYVRDFRLESLTRPRSSDLFRVPQGGAFAGIDLDLSVRAEQDVWLRNDFGRIEGQGELRVRGTTDRPSVAGRITAIEGGTIRFRNVEYRVLGGSLDFADPEVINPIFDIQAETRVGEYQVTLHVEGTVDDFHYDLASIPPLPDQDIVALLLTGRTLGSLGPQTGGFAEETIGSYLSGLTGELTGKYLAGRSGFDVLSIDPLQVNAQGDPTTRITLGKQVTPDLFVAYSNDVGSTQGSIYQLDYALTRDFHFTSLRDRDGSIGGDFKIILRGRVPALPGVVEETSSAPTLRTLKIEGDLKYDEKRVRRRLRVRPGRPRNRSAVNDGVDRVLKFYRDRGYLMADVDSHESPAPDGKVDLVVHVQAGPRVRIEIEGARFKSALRQELSPFWEKGLFLEEIVEQARARLETIYRDRGYLKAEIVPLVLQDDAERMRVRFTIRRDGRTRAREVRLEGVSQLPGKDVRKVIRTSAVGLFHRGLVRQVTLEEDVDAIRQLYLSRGFPLVSVDTPEIALDAGGRRAIVTFGVLEGPHVEFGPPRFEGNHAFSAGELGKTARLPIGKPYTIADLDLAQVRLRRRYDDEGFPDARIAYRPLKIGAGAGAHVEGPVFEIREGLHQRVGRIYVRGHILTREPVILKALKVQPLTSLRRADLQASETRLYGRGIFRSVSVEPLRPEADGAPVSPAAPATSGAAATAPPAATVPPAAPPAPPAEPVAPAAPPTPPAEAATPEPKPESAAAPPGAVSPAPAEGASSIAEAAPGGMVTRDVLVSVREMAAITQVFGMGFASDEGVRGLYEISNRNILGGGRFVGLQTRASRLQQRGALSYREKGIFGGGYDVLASSFAENEARPSFDVRTVGSSIQIDRRFTRATRMLYRYSLRDVNLSDTAAVFEGSTLRLSSFGTSGIHDTRDAPFDPTRGHYLGGEVQLFGSAIGSEAEFVKMYAQIYRFRKVFPGTVWAQALRAGAAVPFGSSKTGPVVACPEGTITDSGVPPSERFFAGGDTTVRGFARDRVGEQCDGKPLGGEGLFILNEELRFPIYKMIGGVLFYDAGNVYRTLDKYNVRNLRQVAGAGLRLLTPIGPFRLEYGALLDREEGEARGEFFFSIGQAF